MDRENSWQMNLFLDESGSFVPGAPRPEAWCVVAAYVVPEAHSRPVGKALRRLKRRLGRGPHEEIKLRDISDERTYLAFMGDLAAYDGVVYAAAVDVHRNRPDVITRHHARQTDGLREHLPKVIDDEARAVLSARAARFAQLSPQLYLQAMCQYHLLAAILRHAVMYFAQRVPSTLARFRWRIDRKNALNSIFDDTLRDHAAPMLQSLSMQEPSLWLMAADYSYFERFRFTDGAPAYLNDTYGLEVGGGFNVAMVMHEDLKFVDSAQDLGVQISDLLASGLRRCLRGEFTNNVAVAAALGRLLVQAPDADPPIALLTLDQGAALDPQAPAYRAVWEMKRRARPMVSKRQ